MSRKKSQELGISQGNYELLGKYISAFCNLYAITPVYRAWRIIEKQNPGIEVSKEQFLAFLEGIEDEMYCGVVGPEDLYEDIQEATPSMKWEILIDYLFEDFDRYEELKELQQDKPFYVPDKEELLKFADENYIEKTREYQALTDFVDKKLQAKQVDDVMEDIYDMARFVHADLEEAIFSLKRIGKIKRFPTEELENEFVKLYFAMENKTRSPENRGHTPQEISILMGE